MSNETGILEVAERGFLKPLKAAEVLKEVEAGAYTRLLLSSN